MRTLNKDCFRKEWIDARSREIRTGNTFLEKCLHAFELLGRLQQEGLDFVFKGGTSLLLRLPEPKRLSIDIDIVSRERPDRLERILGRCVSPPFTGHEEDRRHHNRPPRRRHWNFQYNSINPAGPEQYVILDVLEEDVLYPDVEDVVIKTAFLEPDHEIRVRVPTVDNLLADKLTAFAPETIGQPYIDDHREKILKHLFDIGELFNAAEDMNVIRNVYRRIAAAEIDYRKGEKTVTIDQCLDNTIETARLVSGMQINKNFDEGKCQLLRDGIGDLANHLIGTSFNIREAATAAGKAAFLAASIRRDAMSSLTGVRFDLKQVAELAGKSLARFPELNGIEKVNPEAFHYWDLTSQRLG